MKGLRQAFKSLPIEFVASSQQLRTERPLRLNASQLESVAEAIEIFVDEKHFDAAGQCLLWLDAGSRFLLLSSMDPEYLGVLASQPTDKTCDPFDQGIFLALQEAIKSTGNGVEVQRLLSYCSCFRGARVALQAGWADVYWRLHASLEVKDQQSLNAIAPCPHDWPSRELAQTSPQAVRSQIKSAFAEGGPSAGLKACQHWLDNLASQLGPEGELLVRAAVAQALATHTPGADRAPGSRQWSQEERAQHAALSASCWIVDSFCALFHRLKDGPRLTLLPLALQQATAAQGAQRLASLRALFTLRQTWCLKGGATDAKWMGVPLKEVFDRLLKPGSDLTVPERAQLIDMRENLEAEPAPMGSHGLLGSAWSNVSKIFLSVPGIRFDWRNSVLLVDAILHLDAKHVNPFKTGIEQLLAYQRPDAARNCLLWLDAGSRWAVLSSLPPQCLEALASQGQPQADFDVALFCAIQEAMRSAGNTDAVERLLLHCSPLRGARLALQAGWADLYWRCRSTLSMADKDRLEALAPRPDNWLSEQQALSSPGEVQAAVAREFEGGPSSGLQACGRWLEEVIPQLSGVGALLARGALAQVLGDHEPKDDWASDERTLHEKLSAACWIADMSPTLFDQVQDERERLALMLVAAKQAANADGAADRTKGMEALFSLQQDLSQKGRASEAGELRDYLLQAIESLLGASSDEPTEERTRLERLRDQLANTAADHFAHAMANGDLLYAAAFVRQLGRGAEAMKALSQLISIIRERLSAVGIRLDEKALRLSSDSPTDEQQRASQQRLLTVETVLFALSWCGEVAKDQPQCELLISELPQMVGPVRGHHPDSQAVIRRRWMMDALPGLFLADKLPAGLRELCRDYLGGGGDPWPSRVVKLLSQGEGQQWLLRELDAPQGTTVSPPSQLLGELAVLMLTHPGCDDETTTWLLNTLATRCDLRVTLEAAVKTRANTRSTISLWQVAATIAARMADVAARGDGSLGKMQDATLQPGWNELFAFGQELAEQVRVQQTEHHGVRVDADTAAKEMGAYVNRTKTRAQPVESPGALEFFQSMWLLSVLGGQGATVPGEASRSFLRHRYPGAVFKPLSDGTLVRWWARGQPDPALEKQVSSMGTEPLLKLLPPAQRDWLRAQVGMAMLNDLEIIACTVLKGIKDEAPSVFCWSPEWAVALVRAVHGLLRAREVSAQAFAGGITGAHAQVLAVILSAAEKQFPKELALLLENEPDLSWLTTLIAIQRDYKGAPLPRERGAEEVRNMQERLVALLDSVSSGTGSVPSGQ